MVSMSRASESLVGAWANSCKVRGRLSLLMMARPVIQSMLNRVHIYREQVGRGTSTGPYASRNYFTAAAIYGQAYTALLWQKEASDIPCKYELLTFSYLTQCALLPC